MQRSVKRTDTSAEQVFDYYLAMLADDLPEPEKNYRFGKDGDPRFEIDRAFPADKVGVEIQGGTWTKGAHSSGVGLRRDYIKNNLAVIYGWKMLYFTPDMLERDPIGCIWQVRELVKLPFAERIDNAVSTIQST